MNILGMCPQIVNIYRESNTNGTYGESILGFTLVSTATPTRIVENTAGESILVGREMVVYSHTLFFDSTVSITDNMWFKEVSTGRVFDCQGHENCRGKSAIHHVESMCVQRDQEITI